MNQLVAVDISEEGGAASKKKYNFDMTRSAEGMRIHSPASDGLISDWDWLERVWENSMTNVLHADNKDTPVMMTEKVYNTSANRRRYFFPCLGWICCCPCFMHCIGIFSGFAK